MKKYYSILTAVLIVVAAIAVMGRVRQAGLAEGTKAPAFTLQDLNGNSVSLADYSGRVIMLNFWSAACDPCRREMPDMQLVYDELKGAGFEIIAVNVNDLPAIAGRFLRDNGYTFTVLKDDGRVSRLYEVQYIPKTLIIDKRGIIRSVHVGQLSAPDLRRLVQKWL